MPGLLNHISGTLEKLEVMIPDESEKLLGTIRCPMNLGMITERMPKAKYGIKRTQSLPPEKLDSLPELQKKEMLASKLASNRLSMALPIPLKQVAERNRSVLDPICEDQPIENPKSAEPNLNKSKA